MARLQGGLGLPIKCSCGAEFYRLDRLQSNSAESMRLSVWFVFCVFFLVSDKKAKDLELGAL